jgi:hypothetical protein
MDVTQQGAPLTKQLSGGMDFATSMTSSHGSHGAGQAMDIDFNQIDFTADYDLLGQPPFVAPTPAVAKPSRVVASQPIANGVAGAQKPGAHSFCR